MKSPLVAGASLVLPLVASALGTALLPSLWTGLWPGLLPGASPDPSPQEAAAAAAQEEDTLLSRLDFLSGRWVQTFDGNRLEETWSPASGDAMVGMLRWARGGSVWLYEMVAIEASEEHGLEFLLRHFSRELEPWDSEKDGPLRMPLLDLTADTVVFENPALDAPRRITYRRSKDTLSILLEQAEGDGLAVMNAFQFELDE